VAMMVLGLAAPASAAPVATALSPSSGPAGCVIAITGTGFDQPGAFALTDVRFTGPGNVLDDVDADFHVVSDTEIWTTVPGAAVTGPITITDGNGGTGNSGTFTDTDPGNCAPTIASFTPTCGVVGTVVTITGTNLLAFGGDDSDVTAPLSPPEGAEVQFNPYTGAATASHTGAAESPTTLVVNVPAAAVDGPLRVTTFDPTTGTVDSTTAFDVAAAAVDCAPVTGTPHARSISFKMKASGKTSGVVKSTEDPAFTDCAAAVPVKIQRKTSGGWKAVGKTTTTDTGSYSKKVKNKSGKQKFRALAPKKSLGDPVTDVCLKAKSATRSA
jgi:hypothetical protein